MFTVDDFNVCDINANGHFVRIEELNKMIEEGALIVNCEKLEEYKHKTRKAVRVMAWTENDLLRMMQTNHKIFGKEILQIKDATDEWLIKYFKSALLGLLDYRAKASCKLFNVEASQFGGIESITPKRIDLTKEQCAEIGNHLLTGIVMRDMYSGQPKINQWDSEIILNYIEKGYSFMSSYKLVKSQLWCDYGTPKERGAEE